ncbi:hypothetical protein BSZ35_10675 [Salinibacter sp. 10B]|uniref:hypothetical protein n=1 Tax=Salinibacter sp. 10B TaxID=1923971 RepID=UPI000CF4433A|nr:hypothetical protein [Salinibacter sp. 10B]PQJ35000.1 hypothetical protein BSZ35_10675 [Salinibacter sp. 10B]
MATGASRDIWDWIDLAIRISAGIAIPLLLFVFGRELRLDRQEAQNADRIRRSIEHLASPNWRERLMGVQVMWHYCRHREHYPLPLVAVLASTIETDSSIRVRRAAGRLFSEIKSEPSANRSAPSTATCKADLPERPFPKIRKIREQLRVYIHIQEEAQEATASAFKRSIDGDTIGTHVVDVVSIEKLDRGPSSTQLRFFNAQQRTLVDSLLAHTSRLPAFSSRIDVKNLSDEYGRITDHFELWIAPQSQ